jgi:hypothetical protein
VTLARVGTLRNLSVTEGVAGVVDLSTNGDVFVESRRTEEVSRGLCVRHA